MTSNIPLIRKAEVRAQHVDNPCYHPTSVNVPTNDGVTTIVYGGASKRLVVASKIYAKLLEGCDQHVTDEYLQLTASLALRAADALLKSEKGESDAGAQQEAGRDDQDR